MPDISDKVPGVSLSRLVWASIASAIVAAGAFVLLGETLFVKDKLAKADICLVLGGPEYRSLYAIDLYKNGLCGTLLFIGGQVGRGDHAISERRRTLALEQGIPEDAIAVDTTDVYSTFGEIGRLRTFIDGHAAEETPTVMLISDPYHMRRTRMVYRWIVGDKARSQMAPVPFERTPMPREWWTDIMSIKRIMREFVKITYYQIRYLFSSTILDKWISQLELINE